MSNANGPKTKACPRCKERKLMTGRHSEYNAVSEDGIQICADCRVQELVAQALERRD